MYGGAATVGLHMFFLGSTSFIYVGWPRGSFLHCLMDPSFTRLGWRIPPSVLCGSHHNHPAGVNDQPEAPFRRGLELELEMPLSQSSSPLPPSTSHEKAKPEITNASTNLDSEFPAFPPLEYLIWDLTPLESWRPCCFREHAELGFEICGNLSNQRGRLGLRNGRRNRDMRVSEICP